MLGLGVLTKLLGQMAEAPVVVGADICLNQRHKQSDCHRCVVLCPKDAVGLQDAPVINAEKCVSCGLCWRGCPTEALTLRGMTHGQLLSQARALLADATAIDLVCPRTADDAGANGDAVLEMTCLAQVSPGLLMGAAQAGAREIWLNDGACDGCELGPAHRQIKETVALTKPLLNAFALPTMLSLSTEGPKRGHGSAARRVRATDVLHSRRELLTLFSNRVVREVKGSLAEPLANVLDAISPPPSSRRVLPQRVPSDRVLLLSALMGLGEPAQPDLKLAGWPVARAEVDDECSGCELCSMFCPTGAIVRTEHDGRLSIDFHAAYCVDCKVCEEVCPSSSLRLLDDVTLADILSTRGRTLVAGPLVACSECGGPALGRAKGTLCFICQKRAQESAAVEAVPEE